MCGERRGGLELSTVGHGEAGSTTAEPVAGNYFISTYPPFSCWDRAGAVRYRDVLEVPVVWLPWMMYPVKTKRESGLLLPEISMGKRNGLDIGQPIFLALGDRVDFGEMLIRPHGREWLAWTTADSRRCATWRRGAG